MTWSRGGLRRRRARVLHNLEGQRSIMADGQSGERYDVQLTGILLPGRSAEEVVDGIAALYGAERRQVARLLAAAPCVCKSDLSRTRAQRHVLALERLGAVAVIAPRPGAAARPHSGGVDTAAAVAASEASASAAGPLASARHRGADADGTDGHSARRSTAPLDATGSVATTAVRADRRPWQWGLLGLCAGFALGLIAAWWVLPQQADPTDAEPSAAASDLAPKRAARSPAAAAAPTETTPAERAAFAAAQAGPFGLGQGRAIATLDIVADGPGPGQWRLGSVPRSLPLIDRVVVHAAEGTGLCGIDAQSRVIETDADGMALRAAFGQLQTALDERYGALRRTNIRVSRAGAESDRSWMQRLGSGEHGLTSTWSAPEGATLADDLTRISLTASAVAEDRGLIRITYRFSNYPECAAELASAAATGSGEAD
jgi:hypothetical protein